MIDDLIDPSTTSLPSTFFSVFLEEEGEGRDRNATRGTSGMGGMDGMDGNETRMGWKLAFPYWEPG